MVLASTYPRWRDDPEPGFVHELCRRLASRFEVIVVCPHAPGALHQEDLDGVEVHRYRYAPSCWERLVNDGGIVGNLRRHRWMLALVPGFVVMQAWHAWRIARQRPITVLHAHWLIPQGAIAAALQLILRRPIPYVVTSHGADLYALRAKPVVTLKKWVLKRAAAITVVSSAMRKLVVQMGVPAHAVNVLPMGVDLAERFVPAKSVRDGNELLFVGRLVEKKGLRHLIDAMPLVLQEFPHATLTIAGFGPDEGPLKALAGKRDVAHAVRFLGAVPQAKLPALYQRASVFVAPFVTAATGDQEGLPVALMEAVGCGCPVVAGYVQGLEDILGEDTPVITVDPTDAQALALRIVGVLRAPDEAQATAARVRSRAHDLLDWSQVERRYGDVLAQACSGGLRR
nr:glycosyltransferase [Variovorax dokdonensis]